MIYSGYGAKLNYGKEVLYDFLKNEWVDWGKMLTNFSRQFLKFTKSKGDSTDISSPKCLIIDDTMLCKTGKTIEHTGNEGAGLRSLSRNKNRTRDMKNKELAN